MKLLFSVILAALIQSTSYAQTKKIAHRSHSGSNTSFSLNSIDNFGETPEMIRAWEEEQLKEKTKKEQEETNKKKLKEEPKKQAPAEGDLKIEKPISSKSTEKSKKELKREKKEQKKAEKAVKKAEKKTTSNFHEDDNAKAKITPKHQAIDNNEEVINRTSHHQKSQASVNWLILILIIALPSAFALKSINIKL